MLEVTGSYARNVLGVFFVYNMFAIMTIIFFAFIILLVMNYKEIAKPFEKINRKTCLILLVIFIIGFILRNDSYFYGFGYDGIFYPETANNFFETGLFVKGCAIGDANDCKLYHQALFPAGFPYMIMLTYYLFGQNAIFGMMLSAFLGSFSIILVFLIAYYLFRKEEIGIYSAIVFTLIPLEIMINGSGAVRPVSSFFMALSVLLFLLAVDKNKIKIWSLFAITLSYTIYVRQENSVLIIPLSLLFISKHRKEIKSLRIEKISQTIKKYWLPIVIFFISQIPVQHWILFGEVGWNGNNPILSTLYFYHTAPVMLRLLFIDYLWLKVLFNPLTSIMLFIGIYFALKDKEKIKILFLWLWFLVFFIFNSSYFLCQGYPENNCIGNIVRYMTTLSLPYSMISGLVLFKITNKIKINKSVTMAVSFLLIFAISFIFSGLSLPNSFMKDGRLDEQYVGDAIRTINRTDKDCLLFVSQYALPHSDLLGENKRRWVDVDLIMNSTLPWIWDEVKNSSCIVYISDYRCRQMRDEQCDFIYRNFDLELMFKENSVEAYGLRLKEK
jgi:hypothetical protein